MNRVAVWALLALLLVGCEPTFEMQPISTAGAIGAADNSLRFVVAFKDNDGKYRFCVEPVGPVSRLQNVNVGGTILSQGSVNVDGKGQGKGASKSPRDGEASGSAGGQFQYGTTGSIDANVSVGVTQSLARIYEVGEIMQLAHAMSFRLCEARASGAIADEKEYIALLQHVFDQTSVIMLANSAHDAAALIPVLANELTSADAEAKLLADRCRDSPKAPDLTLAGTGPKTQSSTLCANNQAATEELQPTAIEAALNKPIPPPTGSGASGPSPVELERRAAEIGRRQREVAERRAKILHQMEEARQVYDAALALAPNRPGTGAPVGGPPPADGSSGAPPKPDAAAPSPNSRH